MKNKLLKDLKLGDMKLHQPPVKEKADEVPRFNNYTKNGTHQADLLFLPQDKGSSNVGTGSSYALVVVDVHTGKTDARPLKSKTPAETLKALQDIYSSNILDYPARLETDPGSEFKGAFQKHLENKGIDLRHGKTGRHRQQAVVEHRNGLIGEALNLRMAALEQISGTTSRQWVDYLPKVISAVNNNLPKRNKVDRAEGDKFPFEIGNDDVLEEGTWVRVPLEQPKNYVTGQRLHGKFRKGDQRWDSRIRTIKQILVRPDQPVMYLVNLPDSDSKLEKVGYTRKQLQVVTDNEPEPEPDNLRGASEQPLTFETYNVHSLKGKKTERGKVKYLVRWVGYPKEQDWTWEPASELEKNPRIKRLINQFKEY